MNTFTHKPTAGANLVWGKLLMVLHLQEYVVHKIIR